LTKATLTWKGEMMVVLWMTLILLCLLIATGSALIALRLQYRLLDKTRQEREAWQQAQEGRQRTWEVRQGKHILDAEKKLADQLKEARREWRTWSLEVEQNHRAWLERADIEKELARLPHVEHLELSLKAGSQRQQPTGWRPPMLYQADLRGRDLAYRYMERADLREAALTGANLYMADLTGAILTGANLENANLTGANLSGADLRGANLSGASFLVADLHNALLHGAILLGARHLSTQQLHTALYDGTTVIDSSLDLTLPRLPGIQVTPADLLSIPQGKQENAETSAETPFTEQDASDEPSTASPDAAPGPESEQATSPEQPLIPVGEREAAPEARAPEQFPTPGNAQEKLAEPDEEPDASDPAQASAEKPESGKIIQLSARTAKTVQPPNTERQNGPAKGSSRKGKSALNQVKKKSSG
jgi:hypothetical protein